MTMQKGTIGVTTDNIFPVIKKFLYSDHEIFLRELVSNAVDATQKLKTLTSVGDFKGELGDLKVSVSVDKNAGTLIVSDHGIGMTAEEIEKYINQIAFSGAEEFLEKYKNDANAIIGHFGLGLKDYVHFTSPIRRYADLLIHRALIKALKLPDGGGLEDKTDVRVFEDIGVHISETERKAVNAEREMLSRYLAEYLSPARGQVFDVVITGFSTAGIFVRVNEIGAEGLILMKTLPADHYILPENKLFLRGARSKREFHLGDKIKAVLKEANPATGGLVFRLYGE